MDNTKLKDLSLIDLVNYKIRLLELRDIVKDLNRNDSVLNKDNSNNNLAIIYSLLDKEYMLEDIITLVNNEIDNKINKLSREEVSFLKNLFMLELEKVSQDDEISVNDFYSKRNAQYTYLDIDMKLTLRKIKVKKLLVI